jgi:octaprenyl-diphosphate synthase
MTLKEITLPVVDELKKFHAFYKKQMNSEVSLLNLIVNYMTSKRGKQVRPLLVFLSAAASGGVTERTYSGAALVELLHNATLIHDDVVDESSVRRGIPSINSAWNNKIAVLVGDFLLAKGLLSAIDSDEFEFLKATSNAVRRMSEGELLQIQKSKEIDTDEEVYFKIISDKTASLLAACCEIGAISSNNSPEYRLKLHQYGEMAGIAFQIRDDIFDLTSKSRSIGKPIGNDLKEKKITLPLIYACRQAGRRKSKEMVSLVKNGDLKAKDIKNITQFVIDNGGIEYADSVARQYCDKAIEALSSFDDTSAKESLINFARFVTYRNK